MRLSTVLALALLAGAGACNIDLAHDDAGASSGGAGGAGGATGAGGAGGLTGVGGVGASGMVMGCSLLQNSCPAGQACFPYPFESGGPTTTACAYPGTGDVAIPCQTQLECDGTSICSNPGDPASLCLARCDLRLPYCGQGSYCISLREFPGVGACSL